MPIVYNKLFDLLKEKGYTTYKIRQEKLIGREDDRELIERCVHCFHKKVPFFYLAVAS